MGLQLFESKIQTQKIKRKKATSLPLQNSLPPLFSPSIFLFYFRFSALCFYSASLSSYVFILIPHYLLHWSSLFLFLSFTLYFSLSFFSLLHLSHYSILFLSPSLSLSLCFQFYFLFVSLSLSLSLLSLFSE